MVNGALPRFVDFIMYWTFSANIVLAIYNQLQTEYMVILPYSRYWIRHFNSHCAIAVTEFSIS